jgi:hypothetical protein
MLISVGPRTVRSRSWAVVLLRVDTAEEEGDCDSAERADTDTVTPVAAAAEAGSSRGATELDSAWDERAEGACDGEEV